MIVVGQNRSVNKVRALMNVSVTVIMCQEYTYLNSISKYKLQTVDTFSCFLVSHDMLGEPVSQ